jgi:ribonuclease BN (tRNA processing enzyme)
MEDDNVVVTATKVYHDGPRPTYAYRFDIKATGKSVVFSGDTGPGPEGANSGEQLIALAQDADVLVHEAQDNDSNYLILDRIPDPVQREQIRQALEYGHTDVKLLPSIAKQANVGAVVFHHYVPSFIPVDVFYNKAVGAAAAVGYTGRIIAPVDLDVIGF